MAVEIREHYRYKLQLGALLKKYFPSVAFEMKGSWLLNLQYGNKINVCL